MEKLKPVQINLQVCAFNLTCNLKILTLYRTRVPRYLYIVIYMYRPHRSFSIKSPFAAISELMNVTFFYIEKIIKVRRNRFSDKNFLGCSRVKMVYITLDIKFVYNLPLKLAIEQ